MVYRNIKNQKLYKIIDTVVINVTNDNDGQHMVLYKDERGCKYVREYEEFFKKFTKTEFKNIPCE